MFYLQYRPKTLEEIDNSNVRDTITKVLSAKQIPHAFLFVGQKGTGKTSVARIVAKKINNVSSENDSSLDIIEMDAASNRGIEEIKNLIREASFLPMSGKYRVFIIDEAHMITTEAFNALLKTLEEPPSTAIFILATTNLEKVPKTIVSRCSLINFGKAKKEDIVHMLKRIASHENVTIGDDVLSLIASRADQSFRDASKILEELIIQKKLSLNEAREFIGIVGTRNIVEIIATKELKEALAWVERFSKEGGSVKNLLEMALEDLRVLLLAKSGVHTDDNQLQVDFTAKEIVELIRLFTEAYSMLRIAPIESLPLEIAIAEFYNNRNSNIKN